MQYKLHHNQSTGKRFLNIPFFFLIKKNNNFFFPLKPRNIVFDKKIQTLLLHKKLNYVQASAKNEKRTQNPHSIS